jgi:heme/copper-type cytochrome/quinol oxidase subunit 3
MMNWETEIQPEQARIPYSFWIFIINIGAFVATMIASVIMAGTGVSPKYGALLVTPVLVAMTLLSSGVYAGWKYRSVDDRRVRLNKIGLWGNVVLYAITILFLAGINGFRFLQA